MTTFGDFALPSDEEDEDDEEYVPGEESSCEEVSSEEEVEDAGTNSPPKVSKSSPKKKRPVTKTKKDEIAPRKRRRGCFEESKEGASNGEEKEAEEEEEKVEAVEEKKEEKDAASSERSDSLWKDFLQRSKQPLKRENNATKTVERLYDFAGETVRVTQEVEGPKTTKKLSASDLFPAKADTPKPTPSSSAAPKPPARPAESAAQPPIGLPRSNGKPGGVSSLLDKLKEKKKISVLDKSRLDWNSFTSKEGITEELQIHNRGKDGYLEKVAFLERADYRQFEKERDLRLGVKRPNR